MQVGFGPLQHFRRLWIGAEGFQSLPALLKTLLLKERTGLAQGFRLQQATHVVVMTKDLGAERTGIPAVIAVLLDDAAAGRLPPKPEATAAGVDALLAERGVRVVEYAGWSAIDEVERAAGEKSGRPRVKLCSWDELLAAAEREASRS